MIGMHFWRIRFVVWLFMVFGSVLRYSENFHDTLAAMITMMVSTIRISIKVNLVAGVYCMF
jgi:hypothetical protein